MRSSAGSFLIPGAAPSRCIGDPAARRAPRCASRAAAGAREVGWAALRGKLERILAASGLERHGFAAQLQTRCESIGVTAGARTNDAAALLEPLEAFAARAEPARRRRAGGASAHDATPHLRRERLPRRAARRPNPRADRRAADSHDGGRRLRHLPDRNHLARARRGSARRARDAHGRVRDAAARPADRQLSRRHRCGSHRPARDAALVLVDLRLVDARDDVRDDHPAARRPAIRRGNFLQRRDPELDLSGVGDHA